MPDYHKFYEDKYKEIDKKLFNSIITDFNKGVVDLILKENVMFNMPYLNMQLQIRKDKRKPRLENGKLINPVPVDWKKTKELWERNPEAKEKKLLVRYNNSHSSGYVYRVNLQKFSSKVRNKTLIKIETNRSFKRKLGKRIKNLDDPFDSYLLY